MPAQTPLLVSKPQVQFSERFTDSHLSRLTVAQLRKKARDKKLNVSLLTEKWEFVHVLVLEDMYGMEAFVQHTTDTKRRTIFDIPGEIRNKIYGNILIQDQPIVGLYQAGTSAEKRCREQLRMISDLRNMSWANRELRREVREFFFSHNSFHVTGNMTTSYSKFLNDIGADGRANLVKLKLNGTLSCTYNDFFRSMPPSCVKLRDLDMRTYLSQIFDEDSFAELDSYMNFDHDHEIFEDDIILIDYQDDILDLYKIILQVPSLQNLKIKKVVPKSWNMKILERLRFAESIEVSLGRTFAYLRDHGVKVTTRTVKHS